MLYPMFAMILVTFTVGGYLLNMRVAAVKCGEVKLSAFRLNNGEDMPVKMLQAARNYTNLFEMPVFFYAAGTITLALHLYSPIIIVLGWLFVLSRIAHSWIHLTSNNVVRRLQAFMAGNICVLLMWIILVWEYTFHRSF
jgi:hypothetical protein